MANQLKNLLCEYRNVCLAIGNSNARLDIIVRLERIGYWFLALIHPKAHVAPSAKIERLHYWVNAVVNANAVIGVVVSHNAVIADGCHVDCNTTVTARSIVKTKDKIESGQVYKRGGTGKEKVKNIWR